MTLSAKMENSIRHSKNSYCDVIQDANENHDKNRTKLYTFIINLR